MYLVGKKEQRESKCIFSWFKSLVGYYFGLNQIYKNDYYFI